MRCVVEDEYDAAVSSQRLSTNKIVTNVTALVPDLYLFSIILH